MSGPQCCENAPSLSSGSGAGHVEELGGLQSYVTGSADSEIAVLLVSDVFGMLFPPKLIWDFESRNLLFYLVHSLLDKLFGLIQICTFMGSFVSV